jgi:hypothetical protein
MSATFLPHGVTFILYCQQMGGFDFMTFNMTGGPAYLDWDLFIASLSTVSGKKYSKREACCCCEL